MVKILAALSILNSSGASPGATEKVAGLVARATCSGASQSSEYNSLSRQLLGLIQGYLHKAASTRGLLRVGLLTLTRRDFEVSSPYVSTRIFMSVGVLAVSRSPGIIRCGLCLDIAPMDTAMKQALPGVIAG